jgi:hypothetical protein
MKNLFIVVILLFPFGASAQTHPSVLLTPTVLSALSAKVVSNDASWITLKATCDKYLSGTVYPPDHAGVSPPNIASGYLGQNYRTYVMDYGLCYQALLQSNPSAAVPYGAKLVSILTAMSDPAHQIAPGTQEDVIDQNSSYGIRMYATSLATGFDWAYRLLTSEQKVQIINEVNKWVDFWRVGPYPIIISGDAITGVIVYEHGLHYASPPTASIHNSAGVPGSGATLGTVVLDGNGNITSIPVTAGGSAYDPTNPPEVWINGASRTTFEVSHPLSNYYMGYYLAEALAALATQGDNPNAATYWADWSTRVHGQGVGAWEGTYLAGGGWPEGFLNYGELAVESALLSTVAVNDIKGIDLTTTGRPPFTWPTDTIDYMLYATWPNQYSIIDEGAGYCRQTGCNLGIGVDSNAQHPDFLRVLSWYGKYWNHPHGTHIHKFAKDAYAATMAKWPNVLINNLMPDHDWQDFLFWYPNDPDGDYTTLPLAYKASGMQEVFARSDWTTSALWVMHHGSLYVDSPAQGEQFYGSGEVEIVHGSTPFIVIPDGWSLHLPNGDKGKVAGQCDFGGSCTLDLTRNILVGKTRKWYNTFQVSTWDNSQNNLNQFSGPTTIPVLPASGISPLTTLAGGVVVGGTNSTTAITAYENNSTYMFLTDSHLEQMMRNWAGGTTSPITAWNRQEVYLRPSNQVLVFDRTVVTQTDNFDQVVAFHTPALPSVVAQSPMVPGTTRNDVTYNSTFAGSIISILPSGAAVTSWDLDNGSTVWRTEIRNNTCTATSCVTAAPTTQQWLTVLDANTSSSAVYNASNITSDGMTGALLKKPGATANYIVLFNKGAPGTTVSGAQSYAIPIGVASTHVLTELASNTQYSVSYNSRTGGVTVQPGATGTFSITTTTAGVLSFLINPSGTILKANADSVRPPAPTNLQVVVY